jgi:hypothetical protein
LALPVPPKNINSTGVQTVAKDQRTWRGREGGRDCGALLPDVVLALGGGGGGRAAGGGHGGEPLGEVAVEELPVREQHAGYGQDAEAVRGRRLPQRRRGQPRDHDGRRQRHEAPPQQLVPPHAARALGRQPSSPTRPNEPSRSFGSRLPSLQSFPRGHETRSACALSCCCRRHRLRLPRFPSPLALGLAARFAAAGFSAGAGGSWRGDMDAVYFYGVGQARGV